MPPHQTPINSLVGVFDFQEALITQQLAVLANYIYIYQFEVVVFVGTIMSSIGASSAGIYVMEKRVKEKNTKRMEEEKERRGENVGTSTSSVGIIRGNKKVHPGGGDQQVTHN